MISDASQPSGREGFDAFWRGLLVADWSNPDGPLRLNADLQLADLAEAEFFMNTRVFLAAIAEMDGAPATATGNLTRAFVAEMVDKFKIPSLHRESLRGGSKVINEMDLWALHLVRVVCECAGLVARRNKRFQLTKLGRSLLPDNQAGALFRRIFLAYFRKFDLHYNFHLRDVPGIQQTMAVILWRLDTVARDWKPVLGLAPDILLPGVLEQLHNSMIGDFDTEEFILSGYVLKPLFDLGLINRKYVGEWPGISEKDDIRVSALWRKFITFAPIGGLR